MREITTDALEVSSSVGTSVADIADLESESCVVE